ncbi:MAG: RidA family protein [Gammaproteobacteria bacterium]|nr:RidA family protein [Gammaproteobacteria bacterium]
MSRNIISTDSAPQAIGPYSQAVRHGDTVFLSGQIPLDPKTMEVVSGDISAQAHRVLKNLRAVCEAAGGNLDDVLKLNIYMTNLGNFATVNQVMEAYFSEPYPARATVGVAALPLGVEIEMEAVLGL